MLSVQTHTPTAEGRAGLAWTSMQSLLTLGVCVLLDAQPANTLAQVLLAKAPFAGPGTREKVSSRRINLEGNTHAQESNVSQCPV
jgi:hypothetical protein